MTGQIICSRVDAHGIQSRIVVDARRGAPMFALEVWTAIHTRNGHDEFAWRDVMDITDSPGHLYLESSLIAYTEDWLRRSKLVPRGENLIPVVESDAERAKQRDQTPTQGAGSQAGMLGDEKTLARWVSGARMPGEVVLALFLIQADTMEVVGEPVFEHIRHMDKYLQANLGKLDDIHASIDLAASKAHPDWPLARFGEKHDAHEALGVSKFKTFDFYTPRALDGCLDGIKGGTPDATRRAERLLAQRLMEARTAIQGAESAFASLRGMQAEREGLDQLRRDMAEVPVGREGLAETPKRAERARDEAISLLKKCRDTWGWRDVQYDDLLIPGWAIEAVIKAGK